MSSQGSSSSSTDALSETSSSDIRAEIHPAALASALSDGFTTAFPLDTSPVPTSPGSPAYIRGAQSSLDDFGLDKAELLTTDQQEALAPKLARPRTCYVYNHMPDVDPETKYRSLTLRQNTGRKSMASWSGVVSTALNDTHLMEELAV